MSVRNDFSPITSRLRYEIALDYVALRAAELARVVLGQELTIDTLAIFAHQTAEYEFLEKELHRRGPESRFTHGSTLYVSPPALELAGNRIALLGVRRPDVLRPQVGYADYPVADKTYEAIAEMDNPHLRQIVSGRGQDLIELRHPEFDVLGYVVRAREHANDEQGA